MLIGEYIHKLDNKNRISIPVKYRKDLTEQIIVTRGFDKNLFIYSHHEWDKIIEKLEALPAAKADARKMKRFFLSGATEVDIDSAGRVLIPQNLKKFAELGEEVVFVGLNDHVEIWNIKNWDQYKVEMESEEDVSQTLGDIF